MFCYNCLLFLDTFGVDVEEKDLYETMFIFLLVLIPSRNSYFQASKCFGLLS